MQNSEKGMTNISAANGKIAAVKGFSENLVAKDILAQVSQQESMEKQNSERPIVGATCNCNNFR